MKHKFTLITKLCAIEMAEETGRKRKTVRKFGIDPAQTRKWLKDKQKSSRNGSKTSKRKLYMMDRICNTRIWRILFRPGFWKNTRKKKQYLHPILLITLSFYVQILKTVTKRSTYIECTNFCVFGIYLYA